MEGGVVMHGVLVLCSQGFTGRHTAHVHAWALHVAFALPRVHEYAKAWKADMCTHTHCTCRYFGCTLSWPPDAMAHGTAACMPTHTALCKFNDTRTSTCQPDPPTNMLPDTCVHVHTGCDARR